MGQEKIEKIKLKALENHVPIVRDRTILKIINIINERNYHNVLEIGTAVGYSGIMILANSQAKLTTIEKDEQRFLQAQENFTNCSLNSRVVQIKGDALEELKNLLSKKEKFDFVFLDGPKGQYIKYYPLIKEMLIPQGTLFADNILMGGLLEDSSKVNHKNRTMVRNMKKFLEMLESDDDYQTETFKIDDGFTVSKKIK